MQYRPPLRGVDELIRAVHAAYDELSRTTLDNVFLSLQMCMLCILQDSGGNAYALPHMGKAKLRKAGLLPDSLDCTAEVYAHGLEVLKKWTGEALRSLISL